MTLYQAGQRDQKANLLKNQIVPFMIFGAIGALCRFSWASILFTATALTAAKTLLASSKIFSPLDLPKPKPLNPNITTTTVSGFREQELYIELNLVLPDQKEASSNDAALEFVFCVDKSGSMDQYARIQKVREVLLGLLEKIQKEFGRGNTPKISLSVVVFNNEASLLFSKTEIIPGNIESLKQKVSSLSADGRTYIIDALKQATDELTNNHDPRATTNLIFLTDGQDNGFCRYKDTLSGFQDTWTSYHTNLLAIGIGGDHDAKILQAIITGKDSTDFLPNSTYNYIPDGDASGSNAVTLENAVNLIYKQALDQAIQSIELSIGNKDIQVLNTPRSASGEFLLGGLSYGETTQKILRYTPSSHQFPHEIPYTISLKTKDGEQKIEGSFTLLAQNSQDNVRKAALIQELTSAIPRIQNSVLKQAQGSSSSSSDFSQVSAEFELMKKMVKESPFSKDPEILQLLAVLEQVIKSTPFLPNSDSLAKERYMLNTRSNYTNCRRTFNSKAD